MEAARFQQVEIQSTADLWAWLGQNHMQAESVWLVTWKAQHQVCYVSREEVLDALIAHGWIDGRRMKLDADRTMQLVAKRKQRWSRNFGPVDKLWFVNEGPTRRWQNRSAIQLSSRPRLPLKRSVKN